LKQNGDDNFNNDVFKKNPLSSQIDLSRFTQESFKAATDDEKRQQDVMSESTTFFKDGMRKLRKNPLAMGSLLVLAILILTIIIAPMVVPYSYEEILSVNGKRDKGAKNLAPFTYSQMEQKYIEEGGTRFPHIFGTDEQCRDYFVRVIYGTRISLFIGFFASIIVLFIGMLYGSISGYIGGRVDLIMMRIVDIIYSLPDMLMIILLKVVLDERLSFPSGSFLSKLGTSMVSLFIVFGLLYWVGMARLIRGQILSIKENEYVLAARSIGASAGRIIRQHILPNCLSVIIISTALQIPSAIFTESFLSFVGIGVKAPMPSLGSLANSAREGLQSYPYKLVFPALTICLIVLSLNLLGDGLRDAFDPKLRR
jgi:oligopeptide transport system permease protein